VTDSRNGPAATARFFRCARGPAGAQLKGTALCPPLPSPTDRDRLSWSLVWLVAAVRRHVDASAGRSKPNVPRAVRRGRWARPAPRLAHLQSPVQPQTQCRVPRGGLSSRRPTTRHATNLAGRTSALVRGTRGVAVRSRFGSDGGLTTGVPAKPGSRHLRAHPRACDGWPPWLW